jgi:hypothetical protein
VCIQKNVQTVWSNVYSLKMAVSEPKHVAVVAVFNDEHCTVVVSVGFWFVCLVVKRSGSIRFMWCD